MGYFTAGTIEVRVNGTPIKTMPATLKDAGTYEIELRITSKYFKWNNGSKVISQTITVHKQQLAVPTLSDFTFDGKNHDGASLTEKGVLSGFDGATMKLTFTGGPTLRNAGDYVVTIALKDPTNYEFIDDTAASIAARFGAKLASLNEERTEATYDLHISKYLLTVNDAARSLGIPKSLKGALNVIVKGNAERVDCMRINGSHYAVYIAAAGAFTRVTYDTPQAEKRLLGKAAYAVEGLKHSDFQPFPVTVCCDGEKTETIAALVFVLNGKFVAGFPVNEEASLKDGMLEVVIIRQAKRTNFARKIKTMCALAHLFLFGCKVRKKDVLLLRGRRVEIETEEGVLWDFDGEKGTRGRVEIEALPQRMKMFVGKNK